jgi:hypothetical protein
MLLAFIFLQSKAQAMVTTYAAGWFAVIGDIARRGRDQSRQSACWHNTGMMLSIRIREVNLKRHLRIATHGTCKSGVKAGNTPEKGCIFAGMAPLRK